jgi:hypothetical protein
MRPQDLAADDLLTIQLGVDTLVQLGVDTLSVAGSINCDTAEGRASMAGRIPLSDMTGLSRNTSVAQCWRFHNAIWKGSTLCLHREFNGMNPAGLHFSRNV